MILDGIYSRLVNDPGLQGLLGLPADRTDQKTGIFPIVLPAQTPMPAIAYLVVAGHEEDTLDGRGELRVVRLQISSFSNDQTGYAAARDVREAAKDVLIGFAGLLDDGTEVDSIFLLLEHDQWDPIPKYYQASFDVEIAFRNAAT